jgi:hypothetical protein
MLRKLLLALAALVAILVVFVALQPAAFSVERSHRIAAPPERIYPHIASLRAMDVWSPWAKMDPKLKTVYAGPDAGVGASSSWEGPEMGKGRLEITRAVAPREVDMQLTMLEPMAASNEIRFRLEPEGADTAVSWSMSGRNGFVGKLFSLFLDMDTMVGGEFAKGLAALERQVHADATAQEP